VEALKQKALKITKKTVMSANKLEKLVVQKSIKLAHKTAHSILYRSAKKVKLIKVKQAADAKLVKHTKTLGNAVKK